VSSPICLLKTSCHCWNNFWQAVAIACTANSSFALLESGEVYGWGGNDVYQLGLGTATPASNPTAIPGLAGKIITKVRLTVHM
jgi:alpha-tubulin suppressor-like RCC1 family protein